MSGTASDTVTRIAVDVTFMEMRAAPSGPARAFPEGFALRRIRHPEIADYLAIYRRVGAPHCWWMRFEMPPARLQAHLRDPHCEIHLLYDVSGAVWGFFELDMRQPMLPYLSHMGLVPEALGRGLGRPLLDAAIARAWEGSCAYLRVNTCTADHPNALPTYLKAGFSITHVVRELWDIPDRLGLPVPRHLMV